VLRARLRPQPQSPRQPLTQSNFEALVIGLGNPGPGYAGNRHNIGQQVLDALALAAKAKFKSHKSGASVAETRLSSSGPRVLLAKSNGFMNLSGNPTQSLLKYYGLELNQLVVIHDELDIQFGDIRVKFDGGHAGHNGLRDIIAKLGGGAFHRVRFGIGRPAVGGVVADYVLQNFNASEKKQLPDLIIEAAQQVEKLVLKISETPSA
jgi:peptidyl-tRNA hydrolase, PTH1 family